mmetsp:Transcript_17722/g.51022  ORF Transcript_17722/g.51022 Transcript_17722/m.51022 type:complete len:207 (+) Transcript_17722:273-893(+)
MLLTEIVPVVTVSMSGKAEISCTIDIFNPSVVFDSESAAAMSEAVALPDSGGLILESTLTDPADKVISTSATESPTAFAITLFIVSMKLSNKSLAFTSSSYVTDWTVMLNSTVSCAVSGDPVVVAELAAIVSDVLAPAAPDVLGPIVPDVLAPAAPDVLAPAAPEVLGPIGGLLVPPTAWAKDTWSAEIAQTPRLSLPYLQSPTQS